MQNKSSWSLRPLGQSHQEAEDARLRTYHLSLLRNPDQHEPQEVTTSPVFTMRVLDHAERYMWGESSLFSQYGLLAGKSNTLNENKNNRKTASLHPTQDSRIFFNVRVLSSIFICGSQGSGKSYTLSCLLENYLISSDAGKLPKPLTALVFLLGAMWIAHSGLARMTSFIPLQFHPS
jgi:hypothetical protein